MPEISATTIEVAPAPGGMDAGDGRAGRLAAAASARARARAAADPVQVVPRPLARGAPLSRRELLAVLRRPPLHVIPAVERRACRADRGCELCVAACPERALAVGPDGIQVKGGACTGCGACLPACPLGAIIFPPYTGEGLEAQLHALLEGPRDRGEIRIVVFRCEEDVFNDEEGGTPEALPLPWPCTGALSVDVVLRALALGADGVVVAPCAPGCAHRLPVDDLVVRAAFLRAFLGTIGLEGRFALLDGRPEHLEDFVASVRALGPSRLRIAPPPRPPALLRRMAAWCAPSGPAQMVAAAFPLGLVRLTDASACTLCGACADRCPMRALTMRQEGSVRALAFAHAVCSGCADCVPACPEKILSVEASCDVTALAAPPVVLARSPLVRCARCAAEVGPAAMIRRVHALLGRRAADAAGHPALCPQCRVRFGGLSPRGAPPGG